jgi:hypothetical protein
VVPQIAQHQEDDQPRGLLELSRPNKRNRQLKAAEGEMENLSVKQMNIGSRGGQKQSAK